jgi:hypothetical protein
MDVARARHEQVNRLFKVLCNRFKRDVTKHGFFMHAVASIVQLGIMTGEMEVLTY